jgi:hypothetical protein
MSWWQLIIGAAMVVAVVALGWLLLNQPPLD